MCALVKHPGKSLAINLILILNADNTTGEKSKSLETVPQSQPPTQSILVTRQVEVKGGNR